MRDERGGRGEDAIHGVKSGFVFHIFNNFNN
jgi:hypothetical protein